MKILLIAPASGDWHHVGRSGLFNGRTFRFSLLSLLTVAAETPEGAEVEIVDEQIDEVPLDAEVDLVGISCMTAAAPRAYELAAEFRQRGVPVVLGGMHPTLCPEEAIQHADAVVVGEAEGVWPKVVNDAQEGNLKGIYEADGPPILAELKPIPRHLLRGGKYSTQYAVQATRGCPNRCSFCSVSAFHKHKQYRRPVEQVVDEVSKIPAKFFMFVDDNLTADRDYAKALFQGLKPLKKYWVTQSTLGITDNPEFVKLAADAGCIGLFVGLETFSDANLGKVEKEFHRVNEYRERIRLLHSHGIGVEAGIVFGFEGDDPTVFRKTLSLLDELEVDAIQVSIFTPLPGTAQFETVQPRIVDRDWSHYDFHHVVFQHSVMSGEELQAGHDWVTRRFYQPWNIVRRLLRWIRRPRGFATLPYAAAINFAYFGRVIRFGFRGWDPARSTGKTKRGAEQTPDYATNCYLTAMQERRCQLG